ncbi:hypothetical protein BDW74DRAFT_158524 [Aspergillus multicolor]|uniref:uncharacterized protein n=1 Tax=Aspergillus multicolor TaxID=41759 RepID=UPI003CCD5039
MVYTSVSTRGSSKRNQEAGWQHNKRRQAGVTEVSTKMHTEEGRGQLLCKRQYTLKEDNERRATPLEGLEVVGSRLAGRTHNYECEMRKTSKTNWVKLQFLLRFRSRVQRMDQRHRQGNNVSGSCIRDPGLERDRGVSLLETESTAGLSTINNAHCHQTDVSMKRE